MGGTRPEAHFLFLETISKAIPKFTTKRRSDLPGDASAKPPSWSKELKNK